MRVDDTLDIDEALELLFCICWRLTDLFNFGSPGQLIIEEDEEDQTVMGLKLKLTMPKSIR